MDDNLADGAAWHERGPVGEASLKSVVAHLGALVRRHYRGVGRHARTGAFAALLVIYANASAWRWSQQQPGVRRRSVADLNRGHLLMLAVTLVWAAIDRFSLAELGLGRRDARRSMTSGFLVGIAALPIILGGFAYPPLRRATALPSEFRALSGKDVLRLLAGQFLVGSAVLEEVAFRGLLHAQLVGRLGVRSGIAVGAGVFTAWHLVITWHNLAGAGLPSRLFPWLYGGVLGVLFGTGLGLGALRHATGHVLGGIVAHWLMLAGVLLAIARPIGRRAEADGTDGRRT